MRILAIEQSIPGVDPDLIRSRLEEEAQAVWGLKMQDIVREIWFSPDHRAVLMLECAGEAEAREALTRLPLFRDTLIGFELTPLLPYDGFDRLFNKNH
jgi:hypothetical protein